MKVNSGTKCGDVLPRPGWGWAGVASGALGGGLKTTVLNKNNSSR